jgi:hypothetical protein
VTIEFKWVEKLPDDYCTECGQRLHGRIVMLEFDQRDSTYRNGDVPKEFSQGWFPFGRACAEKILKRTKADENALR